MDVNPSQLTVTPGAAAPSAPPAASDVYGAMPWHRRPPEREREREITTSSQPAFSKECKASKQRTS